MNSVWHLAPSALRSVVRSSLLARTGSATSVYFLQDHWLLLPMTEIPTKQSKFAWKLAGASEQQHRSRNHPCVAQTCPWRGIWPSEQRPLIWVGSRSRRQTPQRSSSQCCAFGYWRAGWYQGTCYPFLALWFPFFLFPSLLDAPFLSLDLVHSLCCAGWFWSIRILLQGLPHLFSLLHPPATVQTGWPNACLWTVNKCIFGEHR